MQMRSFALYLNQQKQKSINQQNDECLQSRQELENSKFLHQVFGNTPTQQFADVVEIRFYVSDDEIGDGRRRRRRSGRRTRRTRRRRRRVGPARSPAASAQRRRRRALGERIDVVVKSFALRVRQLGQMHRVKSLHRGADGTLPHFLRARARAQVHEEDDDERGMKDEDEEGDEEDEKYGRMRKRMLKNEK